jgi:hypothetical protein
MKRLFVRRDKDRNTPLSSGPPSSSALTPPAPTIVTQSDEYAPETPFRRSNDLAGAAAPSAIQRKASFFMTVRTMSRGTLPSSQSGSEAGSAPLTTSSRSASSDTSSQIGATPEEGLTVPPPPLSPVNAPKPLNSQPTELKPSWSSWVTSIGKKNTIKPKLTTSTSPTTSVFQAARSTVQTALKGTSRAKRKDHAPEGDEDDEEDEDESGSETSDESDDSGESSSWDPKRNDDDITMTSANASSRGRKAKRTPGPGRRRRTPHSQKQNVQARPVFGNPRVVSAPLSKETSRALANLHALTIDALVPPTSAPPFVQSSSSVPFPRSSNRVHLSSSSTHPHHHHSSSIVCTANAQHSPLHGEILRKRLLRRIERRNLTPSEQVSIQPLSLRSAKPKHAEKRRRPATEETYEDSKAVGGGWSKGMKKWAMRAPFEERVVEWARRDGKVTASAVKRDGRLRVPPLEFSEGAEALAGLHRQNELPPPPSGKSYLCIDSTLTF